MGDHKKHGSELNKCGTFPANIKHIEFKNPIYKQEVPNVVYADFEYMMEKINGVVGGKIRKYRKHVAHSAGDYVKCSVDESLWFSKS